MKLASTVFTLAYRVAESQLTLQENCYHRVWSDFCATRSISHNIDTKHNWLNKTGEELKAHSTYTALGSASVGKLALCMILFFVIRKKEEAN